MRVTDVIILTKELGLSGSTTWANTLLKGMDVIGVQCTHVVLGRKGELSSTGKHVIYTGKASRSFKSRLLRAIKAHKYYAGLYQNVVERYWERKLQKFMAGLGDSVLVIKDFTCPLPGCFEKDGVFVVSVLHQQYQEYVYKYPFDYLCTVSDTVAKASSRLGFPVDEVILNPMDFDFVREQASRFLPDHDDYILFAGRVCKEKGVRELLESFKNLVRSERISPDMRLVFAGYGNLLEELKVEARRLGLSDKVVWLGRVDNPYPYIKNAKLLVLPSYSEAMPYVALEAAFLETPFAVSDFPSAYEFFPDENIFQGQGSKEFCKNLEDKIVELLDTKKFMAKEGILERMDIHYVASRYYSILERVK